MGGATGIPTVCAGMYIPGYSSCVFTNRVVIWDIVCVCLCVCVCVFIHGCYLAVVSGADLAMGCTVPVVRSRVKCVSCLSKFTSKYASGS